MRGRHTQMNMFVRLRPISILAAAAMVVVISTAVTVYACQARSDLHPVILVPGSGGNQLEARLTKEYKPSSLWCRLWSQPSWSRLWFNPLVLVEPFTKCFAERMTLYYHPEIDDYRNAPGVETRAPHFGSTESLLCLDPLIKDATAYMEALVTTLHTLGYTEGDTLFGAPYDFRYGLAPQGHPSLTSTQFLHNLKTLIEHASHSNNDKPVIILTHSLGSLFALHLLNRNTPSWRNRYVKHLITLSAPWAGTVQQMLTFASGYTLGVPFVDPLVVRAEQRSSESNLWLLPNPKQFTDRVLVVAKAINMTYSAHNMSMFLRDIGYGEGVVPYERRVVPLISEGLAAPGVPVSCVFGSGVRTAERLVYGGGGFDGGPEEVVYGDGDGTVNMVSLVALEREWEWEGGQSLKMIRVPGVSHTGILKDGGALEVIVREISEINSNFSLASHYHSQLSTD
ncbi:hypothetical protein Sjap_022649 [Stephania japonica]|uniref:Uncharacterized protein n=1 Tax=Stephania japonica TaxID=461633 RepID=A0AAP0HTV0_9MAGN